MRLALLLTLAGLLCAVEVPATVKHVTDGDTISATLADGSEVKVRLLYIDTPESKDNSHGEAMPEGKAAADHLRVLLPVGTHIELWGPKDALERDRYDRLLAVVSSNDFALMGADDGAQQVRVRQNIQYAMISAGWSPYWRKYGRAPEPMDKAMTEMQEKAKAAKAGAWATAPQYMADKANETTAPKAKD